MYRSIFFLSAILIVGSCTPMVFNSPKPTVRKNLKQYGKKLNLKTILEETDSTLILKVRDVKLQPIDFIYQYDKLNRWYSTTVEATCDSCFKKQITWDLNTKKMEWTKVNSTQYVSKSSQKLILETNPEKPFSYTIRRSNLNRIQYKKLMAGQQAGVK